MKNPKKEIARKVQDEINKFGNIGIGSGTTIAQVILLLEKEKKAEFFSASSMTSLEFIKRGIKENPFPRNIEVYIDGADQISLTKHIAIKGGGGALTREKILWNAAKQVIIVSEDKKLVDQLNFPLPIEIIPFSYLIVRDILLDQKGIEDISLRMTRSGIPFTTDNGNWIFDIKYDNTSINFEQFEKNCRQIPGIVETGIFKLGSKPIKLITETGTKVIS